MSTPKQIAASRANGAKSLGPISLQGKIASSRNSTRHGLFAENVVLEAEDTGRFLELVKSLFQEHNPQTPTEKLLVENIAAARWRQWRIWGMEKVGFDDEVASPSVTDDPPLRAFLAWRNSPDSMRTHELLLRYEIALDRQISRSLLRLLRLQDRRAERHQQELKPREPVESASEPHINPVTTAASSKARSPLSKTVPAKRTQQPVETKPQASAVPPPQPAASAPQNRQGPTPAPKSPLTGVKRLF